MATKQSLSPIETVLFQMVLDLVAGNNDIGAVIARLLERMPLGDPDFDEVAAALRSFTKQQKLVLAGAKKIIDLVETGLDNG